MHAYTHRRTQQGQYALAITAHEMLLTVVYVCVYHIFSYERTNLRLTLQE